MATTGTVAPFIAFGELTVVELDDLVLQWEIRRDLLEASRGRGTDSQRIAMVAMLLSAAPPPESTGVRFTTKI